MGAAGGGLGVVQALRSLMMSSNVFLVDFLLLFYVSDIAMGNYQERLLSLIFAFSPSQTDYVRSCYESLKTES